MSPPSRTGWKEFSIGPASGYSASINPGAVRADGISLLTAVSVAYGVPAVRIVAPGWVADTRYTIVAEAPTWDSDLFRELFLAEMKARFALEAHREKRSYDVFVLTAGKVHDLEKAGDDEPNTRIGLD